MDAFIDLFDPLPIAVLFAIFIAAGLVIVALEHPFSGSRHWSTAGCGRRHGSV